jgi:GNAT superfamily N-acetyltransferase
MSDDFEILAVRIGERDLTVNDEDPQHFVHYYTGTAHLHIDDENEPEIGTFSAIYVDVVGAVVEEVSVFDVFDSDQATLGYFEDLYDYDTGDFRRPIVEAACGADGYLWAPSLLILDRLIIYPPYRGRSRGLKILRELVHLLRAGAGLVAIKPFPLQNEAHFLDERHAAERERFLLDGFPQESRKATAALRRYYRRLGFKLVPKTDYMVLDTGRKLVAEEQLSISPRSRKRD